MNLKKKIGKFIREKFGNGEKPKITLLIIGSRACGKTALIYYLYKFAINYLHSTNTTTQKQTQTETNPPDDADIKILRYDDFIKDITKGIHDKKDFEGTKTDYTNFMIYDFGLFNLKIYNLPGEWFTDAAAFGFEKKLRSFASHLENSADEKLFTILCSEPQYAGKTFQDNYIRALFANQSTEVARQVVTNLGSNVNTIRVTTKFDTALRGQVECPKSGSVRQKSFDIYVKAVEMLNAQDRKYYRMHEQEYQTPHLSSIQSEDKSYLGKFFCTGLYNVNDFSDELYENSMTEKEFKEIHSNNYLKDIRMFGVEEIWDYLLTSVNLKSKFNYFNGKDPNYSLNADTVKHSISLDLYKKIIGKN